MDELDYSYTDEIICPYCGHEHSDSWEASDESDDEQCGECGKHFSYTSYTTRNFTSKKVDCLNGSPHDWKNVSGYYPGYPDAKRCKVCQKSEYGKRDTIVL